MFCQNSSFFTDSKVAHRQLHINNKLECDACPGYSEDCQFVLHRYSCHELRTTGTDSLRSSAVSECPNDLLGCCTCLQ